MAGRITRRHLIAAGSAAGFSRLLPGAEPASPRPYPVRFRRSNPFDPLLAQVDPGHDEFKAEAEAMQITDAWNRGFAEGSVPAEPGLRAPSPRPQRYRAVAPGVERAEYSAEPAGFAEEFRKWRASLGNVTAARFFVLPHGRLRYEIAGNTGGRLYYRTGMWKQAWADGRLAQFEPLEETLVNADAPLFTDITAEAFERTPSFAGQLSRGVPYWRARLDSACGIDVYGNNGVAVGDIDGDGRDEIYVCQPAGLPNRLYKYRDFAMHDLTDEAGLGVLDDTTCALFLDLRNTGTQDLIVLTTTGPLLFLNEEGRFRHKPDAFRFAVSRQGTFTGMAAADYDRDGRLDLYLCTYVYFQSEDQFRYPVPYHDAQNGPPNFLFRNLLTSTGGGFFEDVTASCGLNHNNNRYSFAPAWCDFDGDGWPDLYVANDFGRNNLYKNDGGRFRDIAAEAGVEDIGPGMSAAWFDYDGDGRQDLYVSNMWSAAGQRVVSDPKFRPASGVAREAYRRHTKGNSLYQNRADGAFEETGPAQAVEMGRWAWASDGLDLDNDGAPEILVGCGMLTNNSASDVMSFFWRQVVARSPVESAPAPDYENGWNAINQLIREEHSWNGREPNVVFARRGGRYYDYSGVSGFDYAEDTRAFAAVDLDGDGNLDLVVKNRLGPQVRLLRNAWGAGRRAIAFRLAGDRSNRDAIGAEVEVHFAGRRTVQFVRAGSGYLSQHTKTLHFGLADSTAADFVRVRWPSGAVQQFDKLAAGFRYLIREGSNQFGQEAFIARAPDSPSRHPVTAYNDSRLEPAWLREPVPIPDRRNGPGFVCLYTGGKPPVVRGVPFECVELAPDNPDLAAAYAIFRRYLFDHRAGLALPFLILIDGRGLAHKVYPDVPPESALIEDFRMLNVPGHFRLALPFPGRYYDPPHRNYYRLGAAFFWAGYPEQALVYMNETVRLEPGNGRAHLAIGHLELQAGRPGTARTHLEQAATLIPETPDVWTNLGSLELDAKNYSAALRDFENAIRLRPGLVFAMSGAAQARAGMGEQKTAEEMFQRALELDPNDADTANQFGLFLARQTRNEEARRLFQQAIAVRRDHASAINNLGVLYLQMNQVRDAVAAFRYGLEVAPDDERLYLNLARLYVQSGERERARNVLEQLLARQPQNALALGALAELGARP